jgi:hydroxyacylglutathione hydrolase
MKLIPIPAFEDNYIWVLIDGTQAVVVDPGDAQPVLDALARENLQLQAILVTHHHFDHVDGVDALREATGAVVFGPARETTPEPRTAVTEGQTLLTLGMNWEVWDVPGHTAGHVAYVCQPAGESPLLFCGDTLFSGGCGRLFEGTPQQMLTSLTRLAALPGETRVCCTHEYTLSNLKFALHLEPGNADLVAYQAWCLAQRNQNLPTLPSNIALERKINPFLRSSEPTVLASLQTHDAASVNQLGAFATMRQWKNNYR